MVRGADKDTSIARRIDWLTVILFVVLVTLGWFCICGASYEYGQPDFFNFGLRSGKQLVWIGCAFVLAFAIMLLDDKIFDTYAYGIYIVFMALLLVTPFVATDIHGSYSWIKIGSGLRIQPAEFAKCATALALAKFMGHYGYDIHHSRDFLVSLGLILLPMALIILQRETGSALVYTAFFLVLYREGMNGTFLFAGFAAVVYFVVGLKFADVPMDGTYTPVGEFAVLLLVWAFTSAITLVSPDGRKHFFRIVGYGGGAALLGYLFSRFAIPFDVSYVLLAVIAGMAVYLCVQALLLKRLRFLYIALFAIASTAFFFSIDYMMSDVLEPHQQMRVKVLLGTEKDINDAGYNVNQSKIAIGSGGLLGKGFLNGTQTKLKYVPEQDTDFIFCTVGEEKGFVGAAVVLVLYLVLILRLISLAERQSLAFGRIFGYCVTSILFFHVFINVGMVIGLTPVIGIPLPFFSYGGSSLWGFTILLFIFLRIDAARKE